MKVIVLGAVLASATNATTATITLPEWTVTSTYEAPLRFTLPDPWDPYLEMPAEEPRRARGLPSYTPLRFAPTPPWERVVAQRCHPERERPRSFIACMPRWPAGVL